VQEHRKGRRVGRVAALWRYPVKSMAGEPLDAVDVSWYGLTGDRRWAFVRDGVAQSGFPWLTLRQRFDLRGYQPWFSDPDQPDRSATKVRAPSGAVYDVADPDLAADLWPDGARVIKQDRGIFDAFPLSLITIQTIDLMSQTVGLELDVQRFRPNILVDAEDGQPFGEDAWVGSVLHMGDMRMRVDKRDSRCVVITIDPDTAESDPSILRAVAQDREGCLGVYGSTVEPGRVAVGDPVLIE
jgi:uncharacterized protein YcbX